MTRYPVMMRACAPYDQGKAFYRMQSAYRLRKRKQFQYVYHRGKSCACRELVLLYVRGPRLQVGFSVSRKVGNSVVRNLVKRRLREQFRRLAKRVKPGQYVIVARGTAARASYERNNTAEKALACLVSVYRAVAEPRSGDR